MKKYIIFKSEEFNDPLTKEKLIILFCANKNERIAFIVEDFLNFSFYELPESITKVECAQIIKKILPDLDKSLWNYVRWEKYYGYPAKKFPFIILYGTDIRAYEAALNEYFIQEGKKKFPHLNKNDLKRKFKLKVYYDRFALTQKFAAIKKINIGEWFEIEKFEIDPNHPLYCRIPTARISVDDIIPCSAPSPDFFPIYKIACIDFEVNSHRKGKFPDPWEPEDLIYLISYVYGYQGAKNLKEGVLITTVNTGITEIKDLKNSKPSPVEVCENDEIACLRKLEDYIIETDPDLIFTYNGDSFDFPYWKARYDREGETLGNFGRLIEKTPIFKRNDWASSAIKSKGQELLVIPGRIVVDLYSIIRRERFYDLYTLKYVSEQILRSSDAIDGEDVGTKDDLSAEEQFRIYREGNREEWYQLLHYSLRDSYTPLRIIDKISTVANLFAMARIIGINVEEIYTRGQQHRLENRIFQDRIQHKVVLNPNRETNFNKFKGAVVQPPLLKLMRNTATLDFQSLYPTIMIALNISHDTFLGTNIKFLPEDLNEDDVNVIEVEEGKKHYFVKKHVRVGTIPKLLVEFLKSRNDKKDQMKKEKDEVLRSILDGEQNAIKATTNSFYGFLGAANGKLPIKEGAESVTAFGRKLITQVVDIMRDHFKAIIVYGDTDSVFFTFDEWQSLRGVDNVKILMEKVKDIGEYITNAIDLPPIKIVLDHFYTHYLVQTKKCYLANEVEGTPEGLKVKLSFRGVLNARREHCKWAKRLYSELSTTAIGKPSFDDEHNESKKMDLCHDIILNHVMDLMQLKTPSQDLLKIVQMGENYKNKSYPLCIFSNREREQGRPISPGERFRFWIIKSQKKVLVGNLYRRVLEEGEVIDRYYYVEKLKTAVGRLMCGVFSNNDFFIKLLKQLSAKEALLNSIKNWGDEICPQPLYIIRKQLLNLQHKNN